MSELDRILEEFFDFWWAVEPTHATTVGVHGHDTELERWDPASLEARARGLHGFLQALEGARPASVEASIDRDLVANHIRWQLYALEEARFHEENALVYLQAPLDALYLMAVREHAPAGERALAATARLAAIPRLVDEARANLTRPARIFVETGIAVARGGIGLLTSFLPVDLGRALEDDHAQFARWSNAVRAAETALADFACWLEDDALPRAGERFAVGDEAFRRQLGWQHAVVESPVQLAAWGDALRRDTLREMEQLARRLSGRPDWRQAVADLQAQAGPADLVAAYTDAAERGRAFLVESALVDLPPGEVLQVIPTPEYLRPMIPYAAYLPPAAFEAEQRGLFLVTPAEPGSPGRPAAGIELTTVHEAYPGHHLQFCWANRAGSVARRAFWSSLFAEGWALYSEELMWREGFLAGPEQRLLQLKDLLWRACRVVVDVALHTEGWDVGRATDYLVAEAALDPPGAAAEVRRYCGTPTQPLSYAVGMREIVRLRERARERDGAAFSLRTFHDQLLSWGTIPPALIARGMGLE